MASLVLARQHAGHTVAAGLVLLLLFLLPACSTQAKVSLGSPSSDPTTTPSSSTGGQTAASPIPSSIPPTGPKHIFLIVMENKGYGQVIGSPDAPYINELASKFATSAEYYGLIHPSLPNYLAMISGSSQGYTTDCDDCSVNGRDTLVNQLEAKHLSWGAYIEDMPSACFNGPSRDTYARRHNPWMYFTSISQAPARCQRVVPLSQLSRDLKGGQLPNLVWITPNLKHDMHDGSVRQGDEWLAGFLPTILDSPEWKDGGVLFIVWDEAEDSDKSGCCGKAGGGRVPILVVSRDAKAAYVSRVHYNHYSLLKTIESAWNLGYMGHAGDPEIVGMADLFTKDLTQGQARE